MPKAEDQDYKDMEKETVIFHGKNGKSLGLTSRNRLRDIFE